MALTTVSQPKNPQHVFEYFDEHFNDQRSETFHMVPGPVSPAPASSQDGEKAYPASSVAPRRPGYANALVKGTPAELRARHESVFRLPWDAPTSTNLRWTLAKQAEQLH